MKLEKVNPREVSKAKGWQRPQESGRCVRIKAGLCPGKKLRLLNSLSKLQQETAEGWEGGREARGGQREVRTPGLEGLQSLEGQEPEL